MKPKLTEYERRQIQAMMRKQMPWRKNLVLGSDCMIYWDNETGERTSIVFDLHSITAAACCRWQAESFPSDAQNEIYRAVRRANMVKRIDKWRYMQNIAYIQVTDQLKGAQIMLANTLPNGWQVIDLLNMLETEFSLTAENMGELTHIVGGWSPNAWNNRNWGAKYNRMKALWRKTAEIIGQFEMARKGYVIFKEHGFDGRFVGFKEK